MRFFNRVVLGIVLVSALQAPSAYSNEGNIESKSFLASLYDSVRAASAPVVNTVVVTTATVAFLAYQYGQYTQRQKIYGAQTGLIGDDGVNKLFSSLPGTTIAEKLNHLRTAAQAIGDTAGYERYRQLVEGSSLWVSDKLVRFSEIDAHLDLQSRLRSLVGLATASADAAMDKKLLATSLGQIGDKFLTLKDIDGSTTAFKVRALVDLVRTTTTDAINTELLGTSLGQIGGKLLTLKDVAGSTVSFKISNLVDLVARTTREAAIAAANKEFLGTSLGQIGGKAMTLGDFAGGNMAVRFLSFAETIKASVHQAALAGAKLEILGTSVGQIGGKMMTFGDMSGDTYVARFHYLVELVTRTAQEALLVTTKAAPQVVKEVVTEVAAAAVEGAK